MMPVVAYPLWCPISQGLVTPSEARGLRDLRLSRRLLSAQTEVSESPRFARGDKTPILRSTMKDSSNGYS